MCTLPERHRPARLSVVRGSGVHASAGKPDLTARSADRRCQWYSSQTTVLSEFSMHEKRLVSSGVPNRCAD